ncbi:MAG: carboxypeptidase-like regulatory domain-containing protein [Kofleriaceae bacterium]
MRKAWVGGSVIAVLVAAIWFVVLSTSTAQPVIAPRDVPPSAPARPTPRPSLDWPTTFAEIADGLHGLVIDTKGTPIVGATVDTLVNGETTESITDANGEFALASDRSWIVVRAHAKGFASAEHSFDLPFDATVMLEPEAVIRGHVIDATTRAPIEHANVRVADLETSSDANGAFLFDGLPSADYTVTARASHLSGRVAARVLPGTVSDLVVALDTVPEVTIRLANEDGTPCAPGVVHVRNDKALSGSDWLVDASGVLRSSIRGARYRVSAECANGAALDGEQQLDVSARDLDVTLRFAKGMTVSGRVIDEAGRPVEGATVQIGHHLHRVATTSDGRFALDHLRAGRQDVTIEKAGSLGIFESIDLDRDVTRDFVLRRGVSVNGIVIDTHGKPQAGIPIEGEGQHASTTPDGRFHLDGVATDLDGVARIDIAGESLGIPTSIQRIHLQPDATTEVRFVIAPRDTSITGRVLDREGKPAVGARVVLWGKDVFTVERRVMADGSFIYDHVSEGVDYNLDIMRVDLVTETAKVHAGDTVSLQFKTAKPPI